MKKEEIAFDKERLSAFVKIEKQILDNKKFSVGYENRDFLKNLVTIMMRSHIYSNISEIRNIEHVLEKPTFLDWLFGRERKVNIEVKVKDLLLTTPPKGIDMARIYLMGIKNEDKI